MATTMPEMDDQRVEVRWKVTQGDDWFRPFRVLDDNGDDVTASCAVIAQARVKRASDAAEVVPLEVSGPIVGGRWAGYHEIRADREDTRDVVEQVGDWEMEIIPPDDMDVARTIVGGPLPVAPQTAVRAVGGSS